MDHGTTVASRSMGRHDRSRAQEVIVIAHREREREKEREEVIGVLTNDATWRRSCGNGHTTMRDWSQGGYGG
jgi:hypothetical protein